MSFLHDLQPHPFMGWPNNFCSVMPFPAPPTLFFKKVKVSKYLGYKIQRTTTTGVILPRGFSSRLQTCRCGFCFSSQKNTCTHNNTRLALLFTFNSSILFPSTRTCVLVQRCARHYAIWQSQRWLLLLPAPALTAEAAAAPGAARHPGGVGSNRIQLLVTVFPT